MTRTSLTLAPILLLALATPARAAMLPPPPCTQPPSLATCQNSAYLKSCSAAQPDALGVGGCGPVLLPLYNRQYAATKTPQNTKPVILPLAMVQKTGVSLPGTIFNDALGLKSKSGTVLNAGTGATAADDFYAAIQFYSRNGTLYPRYSADQTMSSCHEYVWKKWGTYSYFNEVSHFWGSDYRSAFEAGAAQFSPANVIARPKRWDGAPIDANQTSMPYVFAGSSIARNPFFAIVPDWLSASDPVQAQILARVRAYGSTMTINSGIVDLGWAERVFSDHDVSGVVEANYLDNERRMNAYAALVEQLLAVQQQIDLIKNPPSGNGTAAAVTGPAKFPPRVGTAAWRTDVMTRATVAMPSVRASIAAQSAASVTSGVGGGTGSGGSVGTGGVGSSFCATHPTLPSCKLLALTNELIAIQGQMTRALLAEWSYDASNGCFGYTVRGNTLDANACDATPHMYVEKYTDLFAYEREQAFDRCIADTGDDFTVMTDPVKKQAFWNDKTFFLDLPYNDNISDIDNRDGLDALRNPTKTDFFDAYEHRAEINDAWHADQDRKRATYAKMTQDLPLVGAANQAHAIGQSFGDQNEIGGDWFGGGYHFTAGWTVTPYNETQMGVTPPDGTPRICRLDGEVHASLEAHAMLLKQQVSLVDAGLRAHTEPGKASLDDAHLTVLGNDVVFQESGDFTGKTYDKQIHVPVASPSYTVIIPVMGIPVEVSVGAALTVDTTLEFKASPPPTCDRLNPTFSATGSAMPRALVTAKATAAVNLGVVAAGVEGDITIIDVQVPMSVSLTMPSDANGINLEIDADADVNMAELAGRVSAYAEINLGVWTDRTELTLFAWDGFHQTVPLFHPHKRYPLKALNYALFKQVEQ